MSEPMNDDYETPQLTTFGTIEEWTLGRAQIVEISLIIDLN